MSSNLINIKEGVLIEISGNSFVDAYQFRNNPPKDWMFLKLADNGGTMIARPGWGSTIVAMVLEFEKAPRKFHRWAEPGVTVDGYSFKLLHNAKVFWILGDEKLIKKSIKIVP